MNNYVIGEKINLLFYTGGAVASANAKKLARNIEKHPEIIKNYTAHSQGSLILANSLRILEREGKTHLFEGKKINMNGSPASMKFMKNFAEKYGIEFNFKVNKGDPVTYLGVNKSNTTNEKHTGKGNDATKGYNKYQEFNKDTGKYEVSIGSKKQKSEKKVKYTKGDIHLINNVKIKKVN